MKSIWYKHTFWYTSTLYQTRSYKNIYTLKNLDIVTWRSSIELLFLYKGEKEIVLRRIKEKRASILVTSCNFALLFTLTFYQHDGFYAVLSIFRILYHLIKGMCPKICENWVILINVLICQFTPWIFESPTDSNI